MCFVLPLRTEQNQNRQLRIGNREAMSFLSSMASPYIYIHTKGNSNIGMCLCMKKSHRLILRFIVIDSWICFFTIHLFWPSPMSCGMLLDSWIGSFFQSDGTTCPVAQRVPSALLAHADHGPCLKSMLGAQWQVKFADDIKTCFFPQWAALALDSLVAAVCGTLRMNTCQHPWRPWPAPVSCATLSTRSIKDIYLYIDLFVYWFMYWLI